MGCSSGKLRVTEDGGLKGTPLHFLKAGWWATSSSLFLFFPCPEPLLINFFFFFFLSLFFMIYYQPCTCGQSVACHRWRHRHVYPNFAWEVGTTVSERGCDICPSQRAASILEWRSTYRLRAAHLTRSASSFFVNKKFLQNILTSFFFWQIASRCLPPLTHSKSMWNQLSECDCCLSFFSFFFFCKKGNKFLLTSFFPHFL